MSGRILAAEALESAHHILRARQQTHGSPIKTHRNIATIWTAYLKMIGITDKDLKPSNVADMMLLLKLAREQGGPFNPDNSLDAVGYSALAAELKSEENL